MVTNTIPVFETNIVQVPATNLVAKPAALATIEATGGVVNTFCPAWAAWSPCCWAASITATGRCGTGK